MIEFLWKSYEFIQQILILNPKYLLLSIAVMMFANSSIQAPPSEYISISAGAFIAATNNTVNLFLVILVASLANLLGTSIWYYIGWIHKLKKKTIATSSREDPKNNWDRIRFLYTSKLERIEQLYIKHGFIIVLLLRNVPVIRSICSYPAGRIKMKITLFLLYSFIGIIIWVTLWVLLGYTLGNLAMIYKWYVAIGVGVLSLSILKFALNIFSGKIINGS